MKSILAVVCCLALGAIPAMGQKKAATETMSDQQFVDFAGQTDMVEANLGKLAQDVGGTQDVKDYGQMLETDHTKDYGDLWTAAGQVGATVPQSIDAKNNETVIGPMHKLTGAAFDRKFIPAMVSGHEHAIAIYQKEAKDAQSPALRSYAETALPVLEKHLDHAKALEKK